MSGNNDADPFDCKTIDPFSAFPKSLNTKEPLMRTKMLLTMCCLYVLAATLTSAQAAPPNKVSAQSAAKAKSSLEQTAKKQIREVIEIFRTSIVEKDKTKFLKIIYNESIPWIGVYDPATIALMREGSTTESKPSRIEVSTVKEFIEGISKNPGKLEEQFANIRITTDGSIGSVVFDYRMVQDGVVANYGEEAWQLVNTDDGWKINSVIYTITPAAASSGIKRKEVKLAASVIAEYVGTYEFRAGMNLVITANGNHLVTQLGNQPKVLYFAESKTRFFDKAWGSTLDFFRDDKGAIAYAVVTEGKVETRLRRLP